MSAETSEAPKKATRTKKRAKIKVDKVFGLSDKLMPRYPRKPTIARYYAVGLFEEDPLTGEMPEPPSSLIPGSYTIFDEGEENIGSQHKYIRNIINTEIVMRDGKQVEEKTDGEVFFPQGVLTIDVKRNWNLYVFLERHQGNGSNPFRDNSKQVIFKRVKEDYVDNAMKLAFEDLIHDAGTHIRNMAIDEARNVCEQLGLPISGTAQDIKFNLREFVKSKENAKRFFEIQPKRSVHSRLLSIDALSLEEIVYDIEKGGYCFWDETDPFHVATVDSDPFEDLVEFLSSSDGTKEYQNLCKRLEQEFISLAG